MNPECQRFAKKYKAGSFLKAGLVNISLKINEAEG